ncbi:hypothetical protein FRC04_007873 [Tulasnella sp. 424]|nr:hypothetical protein FRC04_007873 [Tulasnella sp. 424]KAG8975056.1 hypothetical protein FRC05_006479 [Tulasnella sp. 425]
MSRPGADYTYESQNDQRLDDLHSKIRSLRHITIDIHDDSQRQNNMLDDSGNIFNSFGSGLSASAQRAGRAFGIAPGGTKQMRIIMYSVGGFVLLWLLWKTSGWWWWSGATAPAPDP